MDRHSRRSSSLLVSQAVGLETTRIIRGPWATDPCLLGPGKRPQGCPGWCERAAPVTGELRPEGLLPVTGEPIGLHLILGRRIATGALGWVFEARDERNGELVAVKFLSPAHVTDRDLRSRFAAEGRALAKVSHPGLLRFIASSHVRGWPFIVTELVEGSNLAEFSQTVVRLPLGRALGILRRLGEAITAMHERGVVHNDIKPSNVLLGQDGRVVLADFGLARPCSAVCMARSGEISGTPRYMAPESASASSHRPAPVQDVYGFAVLAFELLGGQPPFVSRSAHELLVAQLTRPVPRVSGLRPELPSAVDFVLGRALEKDPARRTQSVRAVMSDLELALRHGLRRSNLRKRRSLGESGCSFAT